MPQYQKLSSSRRPAWISQIALDEDLSRASPFLKAMDWLKSLCWNYLWLKDDTREDNEAVAGKKPEQELPAETSCLPVTLFNWR